MQSNIEIKFLSEKDMENAKDLDWRYEHVGSGNLGFADKKKNRVFVRSGLDAELTKYLIDHEISHLFEMEGTDEDENGIRHKWIDQIGRTMRQFQTPSGAGPVAQLTPLVQALIGAYAEPLIGGLLGSIGGSVTGAGGTMNALPSGAGISMGAGSGIGSGIGGEVLGKTIKSAPFQAIGKQSSSSFGSGLGSLFGSMFGGSSYGGAAGTPLGNIQTPQQQQSSFQMPTSGSYGAAMPDNSGYVGTGAESLTNSRGMSGLSKMPLNPGLGQAGINLAGQNMSGGFGMPKSSSFDSMFNPQEDQYGFGNLSF